MARVCLYLRRDRGSSVDRCLRIPLRPPRGAPLRGVAKGPTGRGRAH